MGTSDLAERALYQGLIKLAAAYVHVVRGNPIGLMRNLSGARAYLETSEREGPGFAIAAGIDLPALLLAVDERLASAPTIAEALARAPMVLLDLVPPAPPIR